MLCRRLVDSVESPQHLPALDKFPTADSVTFRYYTGRLCMLRDDLRGAEDRLSRALSDTSVYMKQQRAGTGDGVLASAVTATGSAATERNLRRILLYLVPVRLLMGQLMPKVQLLQEHRLHAYVDIVRALRSGDARLFRDTMSRHQAWLIHVGVFMVLERLRLHVFRTLFKRVHEHLAEGKSKMPLSLFKGATDALGLGMTMVRFECTGEKSNKREGGQGVTAKISSITCRT